MKRVFAIFLLFCSLAAGPAAAATSTVWESAGFAELVKGRLSGLSLTANGVLLPGPAQRWSAALGQPALWSLVAGRDGSVYASTGHSGKVFRIDSKGVVSLLWTSEQAEVFALAIDAKGRLYAGTSPNGGVYQIENGKARMIWKCADKYIWNLTLNSGGTLFAGTGESGKVYQLDGNGKGEIYYDTEQGNITALTTGPAGVVYAGTEPNGIVYEITGPQTGTVLYDSNLPEIRAIVPTADGSILVAAMGGAVSTRNGITPAPTSTAQGVVTAATPTVITVTEAHESGNVQAARTSVTSSVTAATSLSASATAGSVAEVAGIEKSAIYRIAPDRTVDTLRSSKEDNVYDLAVSAGSVLFSTDDHGRVYRLDGALSTLLVEPGDGETTRLIQNETSLYFALSNPGRVLAFDSNAHGAGSYLSQVHDSGAVARWGHLQWRGSQLSGLTFQTRTGNAVRPDATWSNWSPPVGNASRASIQSPVARYVQWRANWEKESAAECNSVTVPYLPQNGTPMIRSITVNSILGTNPAKAAASASGSTSAYSVTVTDTGEAPAASTTTSTGQTVSRLQTTQTQVSWQADDPDSDRLTYSLYFRPEDAKEWQLIRSRMQENTLLLDPDVLADGRYLFRVVASDGQSNALEFARQSELVSSSVLIDNTPPIVTMGKPTRNGPIMDIDFAAVDSTSSLKRCEYSVDGGYWQPMEASDGITDTPSESFRLHLEKLRPGEHLVVVRVYDTAGNAGLARLLVP